MTNTLKKLLSLLSDGCFHSGEQLGKQLGVTRSAVWKLITQFPRLGVENESITGKGYRIPNGLDLLSLRKIKKHLSKNTLRYLDKIDLFDQVDSTNDFLLSLVSSYSGVIRACFAEQQLSGKGRWKRRWVSPFGANLSFSLLFPFLKDVSQFSSLSLVVATIVTDVLQDLGIKKGLGLKWPNDVFWKGKKLAGILIEVSCEVHGMNHVVIGVGLNVNMPASAGKKIDQPWVDVQTILKETGDRNRIAGELMNGLIENLFLFQKEGLSPFLSRWRKRDILLNQPVEIVNSLGKIKGIARGINKQGHFLLEDLDGNRHTFTTGEISVRGR